MTRTTCEELADRIVDYVDGELPAEEAEMVARHLSECPRCRQIATDLERSLGLARVIWQDNLADTTAHATSCPHGHATNLRRGWLYGLAVAAGILLVVGVRMRPLLDQSPGDQPLTAEQIEGQVARTGLAAELLAATQMLARCEGTESIVERQYQYLLREYADTPVAKTIRAGLGSGGM